MDHNEQNQEFEAKLKKLEAQEKALRLRELELEIEKQHSQVAFHQTKKMNPVENTSNSWIQKVTKTLKFLVIVIVVVVTVRIASWIALSLMVLAISWVVYKIFMNKNDPST